MSSPSTSHRHQDLEYAPSLRIKTEQLGTGHEIAVSQDGFLTPVSVTRDNRRPNGTSCSWSFVPNGSSAKSHPSSIGSAIPEPCTPPNHGMVEECRILDSDMIHMPHRKDHLMDSPFNNYKSSPMMDMTTSKSWWSSKHDHTDSMRTSHFNTTIPSSAEISMALSLDMDRKLEPALADFQDLSRSWSNAELTRSDPTSSPFRSYPYTTTLPIHSLSMNVHEPSSWQQIVPQEGVDVATIIPSQTMVDMLPSATMCEDGMTEYDPPSPQHQGVWDTGSYHGQKQEFDYITRDLPFNGLREPQQMSDYLPRLPISGYSKTPCSPYSGHSYVSTNSNRISTRSKRLGSRHKSKSTTHSDPTHWEPHVGVPSTYPNAKFSCLTCNSKFQRVEHLRRHNLIHNKEGPKHNCPACNRCFGGRADNLREHFKTHLRETPASRTVRVRFDDFYRMLREFPEISQKQADKYVAKLEIWRREGGHLKSENGSGRSRARRSN